MVKPCVLLKPLIPLCVHHCLSTVLYPILVGREKEYCISGIVLVGGREGGGEGGGGGGWGSEKIVYVKVLKRGGESEYGD